jgi:hypothetical protein
MKKSIFLSIDVRRVAMVLILAGMVTGGISAAVESSPDKVFLTFMFYPRVDQTVAYAVRAMCGNTCTQARCELVSLTPVSGTTEINMSRLGDWCYGHGEVKFSQAGKTRIKANVFVTNPWGSLVLQDEIELTVQPPGRNSSQAAVAGDAAGDDRVYLRFLDFPEAGKQARWAVRALVGNLNKGASGRITASVPVSGDVSFGLHNKPPLEWAFRSGTVTFAQPGLADVRLQVQVTTGTGQTVNLEQQQKVHVGAGRGDEMGQRMVAGEAGEGDWQVELKLMGFPRAGVPIDWSVRGSLGNMVKDVRCQISAGQKLEGQITSKMTAQPFGNWHGSGTVTFTESGIADVMASIYMIQHGQTMILSRNFPIKVLAGRGDREGAGHAGKGEIPRAAYLIEQGKTPRLSEDAGAAAMENGRPGSNMLSPASRHLMIRYHLKYGNPARFQVKPYYPVGHTGEKVVILDCWGDPNTPVMQFILKGDGEREFLVPVSSDLGLVALVEFHWVSGNADSVRIKW